MLLKSPGHFAPSSIAKRSSSNAKLFDNHRGANVEVVVIDLNTAARPAFDLFSGFSLCATLASLETAGLLAELAATGRLDPDSHGLGAPLLDYLAARGIVEECGDRHRFTPLGDAIRADIGYLVWLSRGYGLPMRSIAEFVTGARGTDDHAGRDGSGVAVGSALVGARDLVPQALDLLDGTRVTRVLDLGCGNARFLLEICRRFGATGTGVDEDARACAEAEREINAAGAAGTVSVRQLDAGDLAALPGIAATDLVVTFFLLHEILAAGRAALVDHLRGLARRLPAGAHLLIAEVTPATTEPGQLFSPEFTLVHALMGQRLLDAPGWHAVLADAGFTVAREVRPTMPGALLMLARRAG